VFVALKAAIAALRSGKTLGLVKSDDGWLIDRP
jgi:hypothetical protein